VRRSRLFRKRGRPHTPADLNGLEHIRFSLSGHADVWEFEQGGRMERVAVNARYSVSSSLAVRDALRSGFGVSLIPRPYVEEDLRTGRLQAALEDWSTVRPHSMPFIRRASMWRPSCGRYWSF
jgi:DNA-binding transcriptional LysR family regulator